VGSAYPLAGQSILVVEDEPLIALEMAMLFESAGAQVLCVRTRAQARDTIADQAVRAAVLDYGLADGSTAALCGLLTERRIPFLFYSGYADLDRRFPNAVVVAKPSTGQKLLSAVAGLIGLPASA
jgi:DNA-binding response OmpR family regulator